MKLKEYKRPRNAVGKVRFGNPIFDRYTAQELNQHLEQLNELEIKAIKKEFVIESRGKYLGIAQYEIIYLDEHELEKIL
ncbi:MAG: hypothetical protein ACRC17_06355 [Culicoidibacterales bacterium]